MMLGIGTRGRTVLATLLLAALSALCVLTPAATAFAKEGGHHGGEASLALPDLRTVSFAGGINGYYLLVFGLLICALGMVFGIAAYSRIRKLPVHRSMAEISELIYETCKTYLLTQGKFLLILEAFIGVIIFVYFRLLQGMPLGRVLIILLFSLIGIAGSFCVAWFGIRINTFANSRTAFASLRGEAFPVYAIPLKAGMS